MSSHFLWSNWRQGGARLASSMDFVPPIQGYVKECILEPSAKAGAPVAYNDGKYRPHLAKIRHMVHTHALQRTIVGKINTLPAEGEWNMLHLTKLEILLMS